MDPRISLDQWRALVAVVDAGGYAQAAAALHKSQSAVTYAVQKIESVLGVQAFRIEGRKSVLTDTGQMLYRRARALGGEAAELERAARTLSAGWEPEIWLAVEILFPSWLLFDCLARFGQESPNTRVEVIESVLGGVGEALLGGQADLAIAPGVPAGFLGEAIMRVELVPVAHPEHPLHQLGRPVTGQDLRRHRHVVVRDTASTRDRRTATVEVNQRWTVSHAATQIEAVSRGEGFAWLPVERIRKNLERGELAPLDVRQGRVLREELYLIMADPEFAGPGVRRLAAIFREQVASACATAAVGNEQDTP